MTRVRIVLEGESWLSLEAVSECYGCEEAWLEEAFALGLLGPGRRHEGEVLLRASRLDRVAEVIRLGLHQDLGFEAVALLLDRRFLDP